MAKSKNSTESGIKRETFSTGLAGFLATLDSAVGLGNIWKFPYLTGENGGGAFLFTYALCTLLVGIPVMVCEFYLGRKSRKNVVGAFDVLHAKPYWKSIGLMGIISAFFIVFFYSAVAGWVYSYVFKALIGSFVPLATKTAEEAIKIAADQFAYTSGSLIPPIICQITVLAIVSVILIAGVKKA